MSARITLHCDRQWRDGCCPNSLMTDARAIAEARAAADRIGWRHHGSDDADYCPQHSGCGPIRPGAHVIHLHPAEEKP